MDMKLRKILRDFINWQGSKDLLKNPLTVDYELAEAYLEDTEKQLKLYDVVQPKANSCICDEMRRKKVDSWYCSACKTDWI